MVTEIKSRKQNTTEILVKQDTESLIAK